MKLVILAIVLTFVAFATCTDYHFGEVNEEDDYLIANDKVSKRVWLFGTPSKKYTFKQPVRVNNFAFVFISMLFSIF